MTQSGYFRSAFKKGASKVCMRYYGLGKECHIDMR